VVKMRGALLAVPEAIRAAVLWVARRVARPARERREAGAGAEGLAGRRAIAPMSRHPIRRQPARSGCNTTNAVSPGSQPTATKAAGAARAAIAREEVGAT